MATWFSGIYTARSCLPDTLHPMLSPWTSTLCFPLGFWPTGSRLSATVHPMHSSDLPLYLPLCPHYAFHLPPNLCLPLVPGPARPSWSVVRLLPHVFLVSVPESWFDPISHICLMYSPMPWSGLLPHVLVWTSASCLPHVLVWTSVSCFMVRLCVHFPTLLPHAFPCPPHALWLDYVYTDASPSL